VNLKIFINKKENFNTYIKYIKKNYKPKENKFIKKFDNKNRT
jgi:hypothetical protein